MIQRVRHVWVSDVQVWGDRRAPGLLLWWRRTRTGEWEGFCIVAHEGMGAHGDGPYVRQGWVRADSIHDGSTPC